MENLISTTDFNINQWDLLKQEKITVKNCFFNMNLYAKVLKLPIKKNMFVPCQPNGDIMNKPSSCEKLCKPADWCVNGYCDKQGCYREDGIYTDAKKTVLFDGWGFFINSLSGVETGIRNEVIFEDCVIYFRDDKPAMFIEAIKNIQMRIYTIEDLLKTGVNFKLTENFKKVFKLC
jgi:hypothetical protein